MNRYVAMSICGAVVALAILGIEGMAEADIVIYLKKGNKAVPVKVTKYSDYGRVVYAYLPSGASKKLPKSKICAIVDRGRDYVHVINRCAFTPSQLAEIQRVTERQRRRTEATRQAMKEEREAREAEEEAERERSRKDSGAARSALGAPDAAVLSLTKELLQRQRINYDKVEALEGDAIVIEYVPKPGLERHITAEIIKVLECGYTANKMYKGNFDIMVAKVWGDDFPPRLKMLVVVEMRHVEEVIERRRPPFLHIPPHVLCIDLPLPCGSCDTLGRSDVQYHNQRLAD